MINCNPQILGMRYIINKTVLNIVVVHNRVLLISDP